MGGCDEVFFGLDLCDFDGCGGGWGEVDCERVGEGDGADLGEKVELEEGGVEFDDWMAMLVLCDMTIGTGDTDSPNPKALRARCVLCGPLVGRNVVRC